MSFLVDHIADWIGRMTAAHGGIVYDTDGKRYDWGQALARDQYGPDWDSLVPDAPTRADVDRAARWEQGDWPEWVRRAEEEIA